MFVRSGLNTLAPFFPFIQRGDIEAGNQAQYACVRESFMALKSLCFNSTTKRNLWLVSIIGVLAASGTWIAGLHPIPVLIIIGGIISGFANALSFAYSWKTSDIPDLQREMLELKNEVRALKEALELRDRNEMPVILPD